MSRERGCRRNGGVFWSEGKARAKIQKQETHDRFQETDVVHNCRSVIVAEELAKSEAERMQGLDDVRL